MKYERETTGDWVELAGAHELTMRQLFSLWTDHEQARPIVAKLVTDCHFSNAAGTVTGTVDADKLLDLTLLQWDWLRRQVGEATRDNALDPE